MLQLSSKNILVVGLGKSGLSVADKAKKGGANVWYFEDKQSAVSNQQSVAKGFHRFELPTPDSRLSAKASASAGLPTLNFDLVVTSPGIPFDHKVLRLAAQQEWPVISEIEFAYHLLKPGFVIGVTGTNGKTTVVEMLSTVFKCSGKPYTVAGNIGIPLNSLSKIEGTLILELSSFQLHFIDRFRANIGVLLNIEQDHLDWHCCFGQYLQDKLRLFSNQRANDIAVTNADTYVGKQSLPELINEMGTSLKPNKQAELARIKEKGCPRLITFSATGMADYCLEDGYLTAFGEKVIAAKDIKLKGSHNLANALAVLACAKEAGLDSKSISDGLKAFKGLKHRLQFVGKKNGVGFYNDSKSTNPDSTKKAVEAFSEPLVLIMGGRNKGNDFSFLKAYMSSRIKKLVLYGEAASDIRKQIGAGNITKTVDEALVKAVQEAPAGSVVLFSPGCASFDQFDNYIQRGEAFIKAVQKLEARPAR